MTYALRMWVNDQLEEEFSTPNVVYALARFREIVTTPQRQRFCVAVNAEPGPYPARSFTVAMYQQAGT